MEEKSLSWWGDVTTKNKEETIKKNKEIIGERIELFKIIKGILEAADIQFFIEGGTLLGAYRNGQFIYHDNDIDTGCIDTEFVKVKKVLSKSESENMVQISVEDTGIGIKEKDLEIIFEPFKQAESAMTKSFQGTGLGLALCKDIVEMHGGKIWAESEWEKGSKLSFGILEKQAGNA